MLMAIPHHHPTMSGHEGSAAGQSHPGVSPGVGQGERQQSGFKKSIIHKLTWAQDRCRAGLWLCCGDRSLCPLLPSTHSSVFRAVMLQSALASVRYLYPSLAAASKASKWRVDCSSWSLLGSPFSFFLPGGLHAQGHAGPPGRVTGREAGRGLRAQLPPKGSSSSSPSQVPPELSGCLPPCGIVLPLFHQSPQGDHGRQPCPRGRG